MLGERRREVDGVELYTIEAGPDDGPLVICLHGFPEFSYGWRHQIGPLVAAGFRVVLPDGRGYGRSGKPEGVDAYRLSRLGGDVVALAHACGHDRFHLVGHDWGGIVAWWVAAKHPDRVDRLAVINAPHPDVLWPYIRRHPGQLLRSWYVALFQVPGLPERLLAARDFAALRRILRGTSRPGTFSDDDLDLYRSAWSEPGALAGMLNWYRALIRKPGKPVGPVECPTRILWGERDPALSPGLADESLKLCRDGDIVWFENATHWLPHEEPEAVAADLVRFLGDEASGRPLG